MWESSEDEMTSSASEPRVGFGMLAGQAICFTWTGIFSFMLEDNRLKNGNAVSGGNLGVSIVVEFKRYLS